jgi:hypothetical protein
MLDECEQGNGGESNHRGKREASQILLRPRHQSMLINQNSITNVKQVMAMMKLTNMTHSKILREFKMQTVPKGKTVLLALNG